MKEGDRVTLTFNDGVVTEGALQYVAEKGCGVKIITDEGTPFFGTDDGLIPGLGRKLGNWEVIE